MHAQRRLFASLLVATLASACSVDASRPLATYALSTNPAAVSMPVGDEETVELKSEYAYTSTGWSEAEASLTFWSSAPTVAVLGALTPVEGFDGVEDTFGCDADAICYDPKRGAPDLANLGIRCLSPGAATLRIDGVVEVHESDLYASADHKTTATTSIEVTCTPKTAGVCGPEHEHVAMLGEELLGDPDALCVAITDDVDTEPTVHSSDAVAPATPRDGYATIGSQLFARVTLDEDAVASEVLQCGQATTGRTWCVEDDAPLAAGDYYVFADVMEGDLPTEAHPWPMTLGFVFDADGDDQNDYQASPAWPNDWYQGTDIWFELQHEPSYGWFAEAVVPVPAFESIRSRARFIVSGNLAALVVPADELRGAEPAGRGTVFEHDGGYGVYGGSWQGDLEPTVAQGLRASTALTEAR